MKVPFLVVAMALTILSACATDESTGFLIISNETDRALAVFPFPEGTLIDPVPYLPPGSFDENMIASGHRLAFDSVPGYVEGGGVYLFVYVVQRQGAELVLGLTVSDAELKLHHGQVTIDVLPSPRIPP